MPRGISLQTIKQLVKRSFFQHLFGGDPTLERELVAEIRGIFYFTFSQEDGCLLSLPVEAEEMKIAMFSLNSNKAPGLDGYSAHFFKSAWEIVSQDVIEAINCSRQASKGIHYHGFGT